MHGKLILHVNKNHDGKVYGIYGVSQGTIVLSELLARNRISIEKAFFDGILFKWYFDFWSAFWQMTAIFMIGNIFDRLFIDEYWVGHTKAWFIPGTEDLMPYIPIKVKIEKWVGNLIMFSLLSAIIAGIVIFITE